MERKYENIKDRSTERANKELKTWLKESILKAYIKQAYSGVGRFTTISRGTRQINNRRKLKRTKRRYERLLKYLQDIHARDWECKKANRKKWRRIVKYYLDKRKFLDALLKVSGF